MKVLLSGDAEIHFPHLGNTLHGLDVISCRAFGQRLVEIMPEFEIPGESGLFLRCLVNRYLTRAMWSEEMALSTNATLGYYCIWISVQERELQKAFIAERLLRRFG